MALVKSVEIDIGVKGDAASKEKLDAISARAEELKKAFPEYALKIDSMAASERLRVFRADMKATADEVTKPMAPVVLTDEAKKKLLEVQAKAEEVKARFPDFTVQIDDAAAKRKLAIFAADAKLTADAVDRELGSAGSGRRGGLLGRLAGLFGGGGGGGAGGAGSAGGGASSLVSGGLTSPAGLTGLGIGGALLAALAPGLVGLGIGGAVGLGGIGISGLFASQAGTLTKADQAALNKARTPQAKLTATTQLQQDTAAFAPFTGLMANLKTLLSPLMGIIAPFAKALTPIIAQVGQFEQAIGPQLSKMFMASLPFVKAFLTVMEQGGKSLIPAFTQAMDTMVKSGALKLMTQGLVTLIQGISRFVVALGPGMRASAQIFLDVSKLLALTFQAIGKAASWLANVFNDYFHTVRERLKEWRTDWDGARHDVAVVFDGIRHDIAAAWNATWSNTIGRLQRGIADDQKLMSQLRHDIASTFDGIRHDIAAAWDTIWNNTVGRVKTGISNVTGWFHTLPGRVIGALTGFGHALASFATSAFNEMWTAIKNVGANIWSWLTGWVKALPGWLRKLLGISSPSSVFYDIGRNMMLGLFHGIKDHAWKAENLAKKTAAGLGGGFPTGGASGPGAAAAQAWMHAHMGDYGWGQAQWAPLVALWNGESGWRWNAQNPTSPAYGIPQADPGSKMAAAGADWRTNPATQMRWGAEYILVNYGNPATALSDWLGRDPHWYDQGGRLMPGLTMAMNNTGQPERIIPPGGDLAALLEAVIDRLDTLADIGASAPHQAARAYADALNGVARSSAYSSMYGSR